MERSTKHPGHKAGKEPGSGVQNKEEMANIDTAGTTQSTDGHSHMAWKHFLRLFLSLTHTWEGRAREGEKEDY